MPIKRPQKPTLFLSYSSNDECIATIIEDRFNKVTNMGIDISRYDRVQYKESFKTFMNSIHEHDFVLCIVSDDYLKSQACMYEVGEIVKDHNFSKKLFFVVLSEHDSEYYLNSSSSLVAASIYGNEKNRLKYIEYWKNEYEDLKKKIKVINDPEASDFATRKLKEIGKIYRNDIGVFLTYLSDHNGKCFKELYDNDFQDIIQCMFPEWDSRIFAKCNDFKELLTTATKEIVTITGTDYNQIALCAKTSNYQTGLVVFADNISSIKQRYRLTDLNGIMGTVFATGKTINAHNANNDSRYFYAVEETKSELVIPIEIYGNVVGVINSEAETNNYYTKSMQKKLVNIANNLSIALIRLGYASNMSIKDIPYIHVD